MRIDIPVYSRMGPKVRVSDKGALACGPDGSVVWEYDGTLATGRGIYICAAPRSGTVYMTKVLNELGYKIGHEKVEEDGSVGYHLTIIKPKGCLHQTRHPLKQIASMMAHKSWGFIEDVIDIPGRGLMGCMTLWLEWNKLCEEFCIWQYQLERLPEIWDDFCEIIGHEKCDIPDTPKDENSSLKLSYYEKYNYEELTWADLYECDRYLAQKIYDKAKEYGYQLPARAQAESMNLRHLERA